VQVSFYDLRNKILIFIKEKWLGLKVLNGFEIWPGQLLSEGTCMSRT
jgi:hypothetical protein